MRTHNAFLSAVIILLAACGGGTDSSAPEQSASSPSTDSATRTAETPNTGPSDAAGFCALIAPEDVSAALGGKLPLGPPEELDSGCKYPALFGVDGNALAFNRLSRANYDAFKNYENQSGVPFEYIEDLGQEAFVVNNAQVCVLLNDDESLLVGAQVIAFQEELPITQEELKAGLVEIARKVVTEL
jgi:hypothetical protein